MIAFIHIGKTAGSTFKNVLRRSFGIHHCDIVASNEDMILRDADLKHACRVYPGIKSFSSHHFKNSANTLNTSLDYVTFLRDPAQRTASHYQHMVRDLEKQRRDSIPDLKRWLQKGGKNFQTRQITGNDNLGEAKDIIRKSFLFVGLTEQYDRSLNVFAGLSPWPIYHQVEKKNIAPDSTVKKQLLNDGEYLGLIEEATVIDKQLYDWVNDEYFPELSDIASRRSGNENIFTDKDRYRASRMYTNLIYRPSLKVFKLFKSN